MQNRRTYSVGTISAISLLFGPTPTVARGQSYGSQEVAFWWQEPNRHCRDKSPEVSPEDKVSINVTQSVQNLKGNLRGVVRKRARDVTSVTKKMKTKQARVIKSDRFSLFNLFTRHLVRCRGRISPH